MIVPTHPFVLIPSPYHPIQTRTSYSPTWCHFCTTHSHYSCAMHRCMAHHVDRSLPVGRDEIWALTSDATRREASWPFDGRRDAIWQCAVGRDAGIASDANYLYNFVVRRAYFRPGPIKWWFWGLGLMQNAPDRIHGFLLHPVLPYHMVAEWTAAETCAFGCRMGLGFLNATTQCRGPSRYMCSCCIILYYSLSMRVAIGMFTSMLQACKRFVPDYHWQLQLLPLCGP